MNFTLATQDPTQWTDQLALEVALSLEKSGDPFDEIMERNGLSSDDMLRLNQDPLFLKRIEHFRKEIRENGLSFKLKAKMQAEELLKTSWQIIHDPATSPTVKADLIKSTVKWAGYEPKNDTAVQTSTSGVSITINLGDTPNDARTINATYEDESDTPALDLDE